MTSGRVERRRRRRLPAVLALMLTVTVVVAQGVSVEVELGTGRGDRPVMTALVLDAEGEPMTRQEVEFYLLPEFLPNEGKRLTGSNPVFMGSGRTDVVGRASTSYTPPFTGPAVVEARVIDGSGRQLASGQLQAEFVRDFNPIPPAVSQPLDAIRAPLGFGILALGAAIWLFLLVLTFTTVRRISWLGKEVEYRAANVRRWGSKDRG